ncbi:MAG TPA: sigma-70 family RNA polymerase sigma factor [Isosphaeraceae bacterium]|jgi:RNA polymerase sigma factor (sigma-70 family)|nr:sigma-70 family RNA polymerase sigma factor [Isosphaeraceae bacterium]
MATGQGGLIVRHFQRLFGQGTVAGLTEAQLLEQFVARRDELAFQALVARHGPMVLAVCRQLVRDEHCVEDAFQATFLILVRKAASIRQRERLGPWLYGVAYRVAVRARGQAARRHHRERPGSEVEEAAMTQVDETDQLDDFPALHEELSRLPAKYRDPVVLCYLEGQTHDEAAAELRWPVGTVRGRLARARDLLRGRLARRGVTLSALLAGGLFSDSAARAAVPPALLDSTVHAAMRFAASPAAPAGAVSVTVISLMEGVLKTMLLNKVKLAAAIALAVGSIITGAGVLGYQASAGSADPAQASSSGEPKGSRLTANAGIAQQERTVLDPAQPRGERGGEEVDALSDELDEARVEQEVLQIEIQSEKQRLSMEVQQLKQYEFPYHAMMMMGQASREEQEKAQKGAEEQRLQTLKDGKEGIAMIRARYLEDTKKLSRVKRRVQALEKKMNVPSTSAGSIASLESRLTEVEHKLDQLLKAVETKK